VVVIVWELDLQLAVHSVISVISWRSVLMVEETGVPGENYRPATSHMQTLSYNVVSSTPHQERGSNSQLYLIVVVVYCL
jgi:hypothetical protein